jgi:hypothetical protein
MLVKIVGCPLCIFTCRCEDDLLRTVSISLISKKNNLLVRVLLQINGKGNTILVGKKIGYKYNALMVETLSFYI